MFCRYRMDAVGSWLGPALRQLYIAASDNDYIPIRTLIAEHTAEVLLDHAAGPRVEFLHCLFPATNVPETHALAVLLELCENKLGSQVFMARILQASKKNGSTPLHAAWHKLHTGHVQLLLTARADPTVRTTGGYLPHHNAIVWLHRNCPAKTTPDAIEALSTRGAGVHNCTEFERVECYRALADSRDDVTDNGDIQLSQWRIVDHNIYDYSLRLMHKTEAPVRLLFPQCQHVNTVRTSFLLLWYCSLLCGSRHWIKNEM